MKIVNFLLVAATLAIIEVDAVPPVKIIYVKQARSSYKQPLVNQINISQDALDHLTNGVLCFTGKVQETISGLHLYHAPDTASVIEVGEWLIIPASLDHVHQCHQGYAYNPDTRSDFHNITQKTFFPSSWDLATLVNVLAQVLITHISNDGYEIAPVNKSLGSNYEHSSATHNVWIKGVSIGGALLTLHVSLANQGDGIFDLVSAYPRPTNSDGYEIEPLFYDMKAIEMGNDYCDAHGLRSSARETPIAHNVATPTDESDGRNKKSECVDPRAKALHLLSDYLNEPDKIYEHIPSSPRKKAELLINVVKNAPEWSNSLGDLMGAIINKMPADALDQTLSAALKVAVQKNNIGIVKFFVEENGAPVSPEDIALAKEPEIKEVLESYTDVSE